MQRGWNAKGLLALLWRDYEGGRDALARAVGTQPTVLSSINSGKRPLGIDLARRLAAALEVSVLELGAPAEDADEAGRTLLDRQAELAATVGDLLERQVKTEKELAALRSRLRKLEAPAAAGVAAPKRPRRAAR